MKQLQIIIEATSESEILAALQTYVQRAEDEGCYSAVTHPGRRGQGLVATFTPEMKKSVVAKLREQILALQSKEEEGK